MTYTPQNAWDRTPQTGLSSNPGPFLAEVMKNDDPLYSGRLLVYIPDFGGDPAQESSWHLVRYMSPFYGVQPLSNSLQGDSGQTPESYGMWMNPPDKGVKVLVMFINGDRSRGVWIGCLPEIGTHGAIPGQDKADFDIYKIQSRNTDVKGAERPEHSTAPTFSIQGIQEDAQRGKPITTSSLRDTPSRVFGFNTPGGHSFFMDDGNAEDETNKMIRIRTTAGNQIMMNDDSGFVYVINALGTGWIEISPKGHIEVYGKAGINMATEGSINMHADKNIRMHAKKCIQIVADDSIKIQGTQELQLYGGYIHEHGKTGIGVNSGGDRIVTIKGHEHKHATGSLIYNGTCFRWNSGASSTIGPIEPEIPRELSGYQTTVSRAPSHEPWDGHVDENGTINNGAPANTQSVSSARQNSSGAGGAVAADKAASAEVVVEPATVVVSHDEFGNPITQGDVDAAGLTVEEMRALDAITSSDGTSRKINIDSTGWSPQEKVYALQKGYADDNVTVKTVVGTPTYSGRGSAGMPQQTMQYSGRGSVGMPSSNIGNEAAKSYQPGGAFNNAGEFGGTRTLTGSAVASTYQPGGDLNDLGEFGGTSSTPKIGDNVVSYDEFGNPITQADSEAAMGTDPFGPSPENPDDLAKAEEGYVEGQDAGGPVPGRPGGNTGCFSVPPNETPPESSYPEGVAEPAELAMPLAIPPSGGKAITGLKNIAGKEALMKDPAFQGQLAAMKQKFPGLNDDSIYRVIAGESAFNSKAVNKNSGATGLFQFIPSTAKGLGYTTGQIQNMSPAEQLKVYDKYLTQGNYKGGPLGIMQAAPAHANKPGNYIVYAKGTKAWQQNPGWRDPRTGQITVNSINAYYGY